MAPTSTTHRPASTTSALPKPTGIPVPAPTSSGNAKVYITGIVIIVVAIVGLAFWMSWKYLKRKPPMIPHGDDLEPYSYSYEKEKEIHDARRVSSVWDGTPLPTPSPAASPRISRMIILPNSPADQAGSSHSSMYFSTYSAPLKSPKRFSTAAPASPSKLRLSIRPRTPNTQRMSTTSTATMTENELIDYHLSNRNLPVAFGPRSPSRSDRPLPKFPNSSNELSRFSVANTGLPQLNEGPTPLTPQRIFSPAHSRLSSLSASIRHSFFGGGPAMSEAGSPTRSVFNFGIGKKQNRTPSSIPLPTKENQRTVVIGGRFHPLLPDELLLNPDGPETVTVVETYDDGWCIIARMNLGILEVGAVPEWVFGLEEGEDETFGTMRPMRSTSLGVTVDLKVVEQPAAGGEKRASHWALAMTDDRASVISWSNF